MGLILSSLRFCNTRLNNEQDDKMEQILNLHVLHVEPKLSLHMKTLSAILAFTLSLPVVSTATETTQSASTVLELFTSQGCYSCPPADKLLGDTLKDNPNVVAFEFHVDYWDQLIHGGDGSWRDPFSNPEYTARQRYYNTLPLQGRRGVYTPQMIVNGTFSLVGSDARQLSHQLQKQEKIPVHVSAQHNNNSELHITLNGDTSQSADIWHINFIPEIVTQVESGENKGKSMRNFNVVTNMVKVGHWEGGKKTLDLKNITVKDSERCAVMIQKPQGEILGASYCL